MNIKDEDLSKVKFDHNLAQQLLLQDQVETPFHNYMTEPAPERPAMQSRKIPVKTPDLDEGT